MIQVLVKQERVAEIRESCDPDGGWRKDMSLLRDEVLRPVILTHREPGNVSSHRRKRIRRWTTAIHVTEIQSVGMREIVIEPQSELIVVLAEGLGRDESVFSYVWQREKRQDIGRNQINGRENCHLVEWHRCSKKRQLPRRLTAEA